MPDALALLLAIPLGLTPDEENEVALELGSEMGEEFWPDIENAYPDYQMPLAQKPSGRQELAGLLQSTNPVDLPFLMSGGMDNWKAGVMPPLVSSFWGLLFYYAPKEGSHWLSRMKELMRRYG